MNYSLKTRIVGRQSAVMWLLKPVTKDIRCLIRVCKVESGRQLRAGIGKPDGSGRNLDYNRHTPVGKLATGNCALVATRKFHSVCKSHKRIRLR